MIQYKTGNLLYSKCQALVNPVNCVGVMGKGLAIQFRNRFPAMYLEYKHACELQEIVVGKMWIWERMDKTVICFPTKKHWRDGSRLEWIREGLVDLQKVLWSNPYLDSIALPALGCGNGGLDWDEVNLLIEEFASTLPESVQVEVYAPSRP